MKINGKKIVLIVLALCLIVGAVAVYRSQNPTLLKWKKGIKHKITYHWVVASIDETEGLSQINETVFYENNAIVTDKKLNPSNDNKKVYKTDNCTRLVNYTDGYMADFPEDIKFDFKKSPIFVKVESENFDVTVSRELSPYEDVDEYIDYYLNRFILNESYQKGNKITVKEDNLTTKNGYSAQIISATINDSGDARLDGYAYVLIKTDTQYFYRFMFRFDTGFDKFWKILDETVNSIKIFNPIGNAVYDISYKPQEPAFWSDETKAVYKKIKNSDDIRWGIFASDVYDEGINKTIPQIEKNVGYSFPVILSYLQYKWDFPTEFMQKNYEDGKIVELTYQITNSNNIDLFSYTPNLDIYRGIKDEEIRKFARKAKEFGHPFLFRLNNEMNSDWTSYSGIINMSDPEIYVSNWRRFYNIFKEEGVNNAIWIYNPNDNNYPPCNWNNFLAYYPGDEYVQMIGVTGYNTGTYYSEVTGEVWREFETIYDEIDAKYQPFFSEFPWIITEFSSSSVGGNKVKWIDDMFGCINKYKNIKIAVWFSYADYDYRPGFEGKVSRPYWLDETEETLNAFSMGIKKSRAVDGWK